MWINYRMESDSTQKGAIDERSDEEAAPNWEMWDPCPNCHETELNMITESTLSVTTSEHGARQKTTSAGEYEYVECSRCDEILYEYTEGSQHL